MTTNEVKALLQEELTAQETDLRMYNGCQSEFREGYIQGRIVSLRSALGLLQQVPTIIPATREELFDEFSPHSP